MKDYEKLEVQAKLMRLVEGRDVDWEKCVKHLNRPYLTSGWDFTSAFEDYAFAIAIVGDKLYCLYSNHVFTVAGTANSMTGFGYEVPYQGRTCTSIKGGCSWNVPKPKTVKIAGHELPLSDGNGADFSVVL